MDPINNPNELSSEESDEPDQDEQEQLSESTKKTRISYIWNYETKYKTNEEALASIDGKLWSKFYSNNCLDGKKIYYRCKLAKFRGQQCEARFYLYYPHDSEEVILYRAPNEHTNHQNKNIISAKTENKIYELYKSGVSKSSNILEALRQQKLEEPTKAKLASILKKIRSETPKTETYTVSLSEIEAWCERNETIPDSDEIPFIVSKFIKYDDDDDQDDNDNNENDLSLQDENDQNESSNKFRFFLSTKRLLNIASKSTRLHIDSCHRLVWQGFPILIVGTTDMEKKFHPFGLAVCTDDSQNDFEFIFNSIKIGLKRLELKEFEPNVLISNACDHIRNAYQKVFNKSKMIVCWSRMKKCIEKKLSILNNQSMRENILEDISCLQLSQTQTIFDKAIKLFIEKWRMSEPDFVEYFKNEWIDSYCGWFEGYATCSPKTNNSLELAIREIKSWDADRNRIPLSRFVVVLDEIVRKWSTARIPFKLDSILFAKEPSISLDLWTKAYELSKQIKSALFYPSNLVDYRDYYISSDLNDERLTDQNVQKYKSLDWTSFDDFKINHFKIWRVCMPNDSLSWKETSFCNCADFFKNYICNHVIGISIMLKYCTVPSSFKENSDEKKKKCGRPSKNGKARLVK